MVTSEAQKKANRRYYEKCMADPVKKDELYKRMRVNTKNREERIKENNPEELEYRRIRASAHYQNWKKQLKETNPEGYREYLDKARLRYWINLRETRTAKDYERLMRKLKNNSPPFYERVMKELELLKIKEGIL